MRAKPARTVVAVAREAGTDLPRPYLAAGLGGFLLVAAGVPLAAPELLRGNDQPEVFALTHLAVLGWVTMVMMGALHQLFPVALSASIRGPRLARWNFWLFAGAVSGFVPSFFYSWTPGVALFGTLAVVGVLVFAANLLASYPSVRTWHPMAFYVLASLAWLILTVGLGGVYALDWRFGWFDISGPMLAAHVHAGLAGWLSLTLMGVSYKLMAMFSLAHGQGERLALVNLGIWNAGLLGLFSTLVLAPGTPLVPVFAGWLLVSALIFVFDMGRLLRHRRRRRFSLEQWHAFVSFASLPLAAGMGLALAAGRAPGVTWPVAYGYAALVGWLGFAIVGKYYKILPFLAWLRLYAGAAGAGPVPLLKDLVDERRGWISFGLLLPGYALTLAGLLASSLPLVRVGGTVFALGAALFATTVFRLLWPRSASGTRTPVAP